MPAPHELVPPAARMPDVLQHRLKFERYCFVGEVFPGCEFEDVAAAEEFFGPYELKTVFFNSRGARVERARELGRYGAVVEIHHAKRVSRRFFTLCRTADGGAGLDSEAAKGRSGEMVEAAFDRFVPVMTLEEQQAIWAAGLADLAGAAAGTGESLAQMDKQWWVEFKRRFYGLDRVHSKRFDSPRRPQGEQGRILRDGSMEEAGMIREARQMVDAAGEAWVQETGFGFSVCVARHGVLAIDKGYGVISKGERKGEPYTTETVSPLASLTKFLGAVLLLQFVDQGLIGFDEPAAKYLPALADFRQDHPPTIRDLYTHTAGFTGHWGDTLNDMEEVVADVYPTLRANSAHQYHGVGHALGAKIMESIAGESISRLYRRCLLEPLGCVNSTLEKTSYGTTSTARDLVKIGQLMANRGTYGDKLFFTPKTLQGMVPIPGRDRFEPELKIRWGVGIKILDNDGLSEEEFGGSGACGSFLVIDPVRDLVIAMTRFEDGKTYEDFLAHKRAFIQIIKDTLK